MDKELIKKIRDAIVDMYSKVIYTEDGHTYQLKETGEWLQGVSSVSSIIPKDWLSAWGAKEAVKSLGYSDYEGDTELAKEVMKQIAEMKTPEEFFDAGFREHFNERSICIVEWPENGAPALPSPDIAMVLAVSGAGRKIDLLALSDRGSQCLDRLNFVPNL